MYPTPIGMFDSGLGGLSVLREVARQLPEAPVFYVADSARCPYGTRPQEEIIRFSVQITRFLLEKGAGMIVVACNTATGAAIRTLRTTFTEVPFAGIEPAVKPAARLTASGIVGVLATEQTFRGRHYQETSQRHAEGVRILTAIGHGLVELVENGEENSERAIGLLQTYLLPMIEQGADQLVLGCTHYPFLIPAIEKATGGKLNVLDPSPAVARQVHRLWTQLPVRSVLSTPQYQLFTTGAPEPMQKLASRFLPEGSFEVVPIGPFPAA